MHLNAVLQIGSDNNVGDTVAHLERRGSARKTLTLKTCSGSLTGEEMPVAIKDISPQGFLIEAESDALSQGEIIDINLPERGIVTARVVWASNRYFGCQLNEAISPGVIGAALLKADARVAHNASVPAVRSEGASRRASDGQFEPKPNFSVAFYLALLCWAVIGLGIYLVVS